MKVLAHVHFYPPYRMAGSETMIHTMMKALAQAGHDVTVVVSDMPEAPSEWVHDGVPVVSMRGMGAATARVVLDAPDVVVTHHQNAPHAILGARRCGAKSVFVMHNSFPMNRQVLATRPDLTVFNTEWIARSWKHLAGMWMVVHPPVWAHEHQATPGDHVTLVNLSRHKGVEVFQRMSRVFPEVPFLGVTGGHGDQITWGHTPNVEIIPQTADMRRDVWSRTRVLLVPSVYESYGMVAAEAMASGIPVIAHPTPGLQECIAGGGMFAKRESPAAWLVKLRGLLESPEAWQAASDRARQRAAQMDPTPELADWVRVVEGLRPAVAMAA